MMTLNSSTPEEVPVRGLLPEKSDVVILGGGSAGLALAFHLTARSDRKHSVTIVEQKEQYHNDRTWCFWDFDELHPNLKQIVRKKWHNWSFSHQDQLKLHSSAQHPYCAVSAGNYYQVVCEALSNQDECNLVNSCTAGEVVRESDGFMVSTDSGTIWCNYLVDTRPPILNYLCQPPENTSPMAGPQFEGSTLYQVFYGIEIKLRQPLFDETTAQLMSNLRATEKGMGFTYVLPYSPTQALIEYTLFSPHFFSADTLKARCKEEIEELTGANDFEIVHEEGAILPMGFNGLKSGSKNYLFAGMSGGAVRDSTGYGFIRTQRWAARCAREMTAGRMPETIACDTMLDQQMDRIFLHVLRENPELSPQLFMQLAQGLSADAFARFMMEKTTTSDYFKVIMSLPKMVFLRQLLSTS